MVSFRLSAEEYEQIRELCFNNGVRSVSEMARVAISALLHQQPPRAAESSLDARVADLEARLHRLTNEFKGVHQFVQQHREKWTANE